MCQNQGYKLGMVAVLAQQHPVTVSREGAALGYAGGEESDGGRLAI